jgi:hypothetical protein
MALHPADPPKAARQAVHATLADHPGGVAALRTAARGYAATDERAVSMSTSTPHRVALLPLDRIGPKTTLRADAQMRGWRFLVHHGDAVVAAAQTIAGPRGKHSVGHVNHGPFVAATETAIRRAETNRALEHRHFEPVLLMVPALYVAALWLRDLEGDRDRVMVMPPAPRGFKSFAPITPRAFVAKLVPLAGALKRAPARRARR